MGFKKDRGIGQLILIAAIVGISLFNLAYASHTGFDPNNLISDGEFTDIDNMTADEIQRFLQNQGSFLKDYSENSRTAARIIWDAAHGYGEASATINGITINQTTGTVNSEMIIVTLQKEQSIISKTTRDDNALNKAMGYACPDDGSCKPAYAGFTKQVENGAWQLRYNYERAKDRGFSDYQVGQTQTFTNSDSTSTAVTFANRATAALYRYTPHVYNGNHNFHNLYINTYNFQAKEYEAKVISWSSSDGDYIYPEIVPDGQGTNLKIIIKNTGRESWNRNVVNLATTGPQDRVPGFIRESRTSAASGWISPNRIAMQENTVAPGQTATFSFWMAASVDKTPGIYTERFELVADGVRWFPELGVYWEIKILAEAQKYKAQPLFWSSSAGSYVYPSISRGGGGTNLIIKVKNTGKTTWQKGIVNLGTVGPYDRIPGFVRESGIGAASGWISPNRVSMQELSVAPGQSATFNFWLRALLDKAPGVYRERFELVVDGISWFPELGIYWDVTVN